MSEQLSLLASGVVGDGADLTEGLTSLMTTLAESVSGYAGLRLTLTRDGQPVRLTALRPRRPEVAVVTSLRLALPPVSGGFEEGGQLVVWSTVPGALVDLAADLGYVLRDADDGIGRSSARVLLDADLPLPDTPSGVDGLDELAAVNRAAGVLIEQGHDPASVHEVLTRRAASEGLSVHVWADRLLRRRPDG